MKKRNLKQEGSYFPIVNARRVGPAVIVAHEESSFMA